MSLLQNILEVLPQGTTLPLKTGHDKSINKVVQPEDIVRPPLIPEKLDLNKPIIIISAPGAVGKSTLAKYIAHQQKSYLWNLGEIEKIGTNTFDGTLAKCFKLEDLPQLVNEFKNGKISFLVDAFDEAEILSGWVGIECFLGDLVEHVKDVKSPCVVLFARSKTAENMQAWLDLAAEENSIDDGYSRICEIDFFLPNQREEFIDKQLKNASSKHPSTYKEYRDEIFDRFRKVLKSENPNENISLEKSFLGYAPVLQAISQFIAHEGNNYHVSRQQLTGETGSGLICQVMKKLLEREQDKMVSRLKQDSNLNFDDSVWQKVFSPTEQILRIYHLVNQDKILALDVSLIDNKLPDKLAKVYGDSLKTFAEQHPFIGKNNRFAGVAFQDYTIAHLLVEKGGVIDDKDLLSYIDETKPSPLFSVIYHTLSGGNTQAELISYLYESEKSRLGRESESQLMLCKDDKSSKYLAQISGLINHKGKYFASSMSFLFDKPEKIVFNRQLENAYIEFDGMVVFGNKDSSTFKVSDLTLKCTKILFQCNCVEVRNYNDGIVSIQSQEYEQSSARLEVDCKPPDSLIVSWRDVKKYPWIPYFHEIQDAVSEDYRDEMQSLTRILTQFRKHKKHDFARYKDLLDKIIVAQNTTRKAMLDYLVEIKAISTHDFIYILDISILEKHHVNWNLLRKGDVASSKISIFLKDFKEWCKRHK